MYTLKSIARRGTSLTAAFALFVAAIAPAILPALPAYADTLNPLTHRSLTLSSSSPGWSNTDGSGNSTYAPPNSGANGQKTGNTFQFNVSTNSTATGTNAPIKAITFQYCTTSAGECLAPGDDVNATPAGSDDASHADLNVNFPSPSELASGDFSTVVNTTGANGGIVKAVPGYNSGIPADPASAASAVAGNFTVYYNNAGTWTPITGWTLETSNVEDATLGTHTTKKNYITLTNTTGIGLPSDTTVKVVFFGTTNNYITNPGSGAFFVKINTYKAFTAGTPNTVSASDIIDGGVTVANVMNQSIQITTKVLETMQFSVGTVDPNTLSSDRGANPMSDFEKAQFATAPASAAKHSPCDPILTARVLGDPQNVLKLGNQIGESSLEVAHTYSTHSYWRLSSNSSAGATVYYSGHTLSNTVGDQIKPIGAVAAPPQRGAEQFGLAIDNNTSTSPFAVDYSQAENTYENAADNGLSGIDATVATDIAGNPSYHSPQLYPLVAKPDYAGGSGTINPDLGSISTNFAFDPTSDTVPVALATENNKVVDCVTAKMRYIGNIAATTPAGIYTTKVNYIAAPQY